MELRKGGEVGVNWLEVLYELGILVKERVGYRTTFGFVETSTPHYTLNRYGEVPKEIEDDVMAILEKVRKKEQADD